MEGKVILWVTPLSKSRRTSLFLSATVRQRRINKFRMQAKALQGIIGGVWLKCDVLYGFRLHDCKLEIMLTGGAIVKLDLGDRDLGEKVDLKPAPYSLTIGDPDLPLCVGVTAWGILGGCRAATKSEVDFVGCKYEGHLDGD